MDRVKMGCDAGAKANLLRVQLEYIHSEWISHNANSRQSGRSFDQ
jgi:hypothetical protein